MIKNKKVLIVGGDLRMVYLANQMLQHNMVSVIGLKHERLEKGIDYGVNYNEAYDVIIGGIPLSRDGETIHSPTVDEKIPITLLWDIKAEVFVGCKIPTFVFNYFNVRGTKVVDILERGDFAIPNALPTAEGAIEVAMRHTPYILSGSSCLVLGFGRCGKVLAAKLKEMGCKVSVEARKQKDLDFIWSYGFTPIPLETLPEHIGKYDIIFNTIPRLMIDQAMLKRIPQDTLLIDLASKPGGIDFEEAKKQNILAIHALGLPGKCAPRTAAEIIAKCASNILGE